MLQEKIEILKQWVKESNNIAFFGGAGVSTESGIPDFRSVDGLYHMKYAYTPETILSHSFFMNKPKEFYDFYRDKMIYTNASPNITHFKLAELEKVGKLRGVITQNIDNLHQLAGSKKVLELHGSVYRNFCMNCGKFYDINDLLEQSGVPHCSCGGILKPDVVLYEEALDEKTLDEAIELIAHAEMLIIGGTSLSVYPAAGLIQYYEGKRMVLINKSVTAYDNRADLLIQAGLGEVFSGL
ncbi:MAG TPA: NAD-dependent protein deacylase [Mobilitalea sp.]|nr:NAD-dependent protein deacylase [Mobilitalea sp.]